MNDKDLHELLGLRSENKTLKSVNETLKSQNEALRHVLCQHEQQFKTIKSHDFGEPLPNIFKLQAPLPREISDAAIGLFRPGSDLNEIYNHALRLLKEKGLDKQENK